jgi:ankyrin repeat protein
MCSLLRKYCVGEAHHQEVNSDTLKELVSVKSSSGSSALHLAIVGQESIDFVKRLIDANADVNAKNMYGETPLHWGAQKGLAAIVTLLLENGADPCSVDNGRHHRRTLCIKILHELFTNFHLNFHQTAIRLFIGPQNSIAKIRLGC